MFGVIKENKYLIFDRPISRSRYFINSAMSIIKSTYYRLLLDTVHPRNTARKKYYVSVCAIFKDEGVYLKEWIEYHKIAGVDHFYLYNNFSSDNYLQILEPYIDAGEATLIDWPVPQGQMSAYQDCFDKYREETNWIAFIDLDEFIVPNKTDTIGEFLKPFEAKRPAVLLYWRMFGASGIIDRDISGLVVEDFKVSWKKYVNIGKIIFNTAYDLDVNYEKNGYMHIMWGRYRDTWLPPVNIFGRLCLYDIHTMPCDDLPIQINHYVTKSYREYTNKKIRRGSCIFAQSNYDAKYFQNHNKKAQSIDIHIYKYMIPLKLNMRKQSILLVNGGGGGLMNFWRLNVQLSCSVVRLAV